MDAKVFKFWNLTENWKINLIALLVSVCGLLLSILTLFFTPIPGKEIFLLITLAFLISAPFVIKKNYKTYKKKQIELPEIYHKVNNEQKIHRKEIERLKNFIKSNEKSQKQKTNIVVITGKSGVGKSFISRQILSSYAEKYGYKIDQELNEDRTFTIIDKYVENDLLDELSKVPEEKKGHDLNAIVGNIEKNTIIIFDQFEDLFKLPLTNNSNMNNEKSPREQSIELLRQFLLSILHKKNIKIFIILREEFIYNLFVFKECLPWYEFIPIYGINEESQKEIKLGNPKYSTEVTSNIVKQLMTDDNVVLQFDEKRNYKKEHTILPIEATIVLKMLDKMYPNRKTITEEDMKKVGGVRGIIIEYLKRFVETSSNPRNCARVLFALSVSPRENRQLTLDTISQITHLDENEVNSILEELGKNEIIKVIHGSNYLYDWSHDFLAEKFNEFSASILEPEDRDNISFFWHQHRRGINFAEFVIKKDSISNLKKFYGLSMLILSLLLLFIRTFRVPIYNWMPWPHPFSNDLGWELIELIDIPFLFITISLTIWAFYTYWIYKRILIVIQEKGIISIIISNLLPFVSFLCVVGTCLYPTFWITFTGIGGFFVGLKFLHLARIKGKNFLYIFKKRAGWYKSAGIQTIANCTVLILFGLYYAGIFNSDSILKNPTCFHVSMISFVIWFVMVYFGLYISLGSHAMKDIISTRIGEYVRNQYRIQTNIVK